MAASDAEPVTAQVQRGSARAGPGKVEVPADLILEPADSLALAARKILARQAFLMNAHRPGTLAGKDPEALHDLRVASRRARAALRLLRSALPPERMELWRGELRWLGERSGVARDLDVFLDRLKRQLREVGAEPDVRRVLVGEPQAERRKARAALGLALESPRVATLVRELLEVPEPPPELREGVWAEGSARRLAPGLIRTPMRRLRAWRRRRPDWLTARELHAIRIAGKRARYALEFFADLLGGDLRVHLKELVALQNCLGAHQDAVVAMARLGDLSRHRAASGGTPEELATLAALVRLEREAMAARRHEFVELGPRLFDLAGSIARSLA
ncbi:MAG: CHAD domain-containing protein [Chloroflexi bacterium]|nr:CHAD domain-containing protein [Thermoleophilia bacterium]MCU0482896.1 CHAD domain-containing protein [Chloroflexota bacterium]